ncbi:MAG TPA: hypothetical protein VMS11_01785 [Solirubrobacterales bacterium]|nr:hypothetical protein [Solirubrobacterales bacterium]
MAEPGFFDSAEARANGSVCLRCSEPSGYQYVVEGGGYLCPPCCALVDPRRVNDETRDELLSRAERSDEEWEAMGWCPEATVTALPDPQDREEGQQ